MSRMVIYGDSRSGNCYKLQLLAAQLGLDHEWRELDVMSGVTREDWFLARNPNGKIPLIELPDGRCLAESNAGLMYLARRSPLLPADEYDHAQVLQWLFWEQYSHEPYIATVRYWRLFLDADPQYADRYAWRIKSGEAALALMDRYLEGREFFVGGRYSVADIALFAYTHVAADGGFDLDAHPAVQAWLCRVRAQPGFRPMG